MNSERWMFKKCVCVCARACVYLCAHLFYCLISLCLLITLPALHSHLNVSNSWVFAGGHTVSAAVTLLQHTVLTSNGRIIFVLSRCRSRACHFIFF